MNVRIYGVYHNGESLSFAGRLEIARLRHENVPRDIEEQLKIGPVKVGDLITHNEKTWTNRPVYYFMEVE